MSILRTGRKTVLDWNAVWMQEIVAWEMARQRHHERTLRPARGSVGGQIPSFIRALPILPVLLVIGGAYVKLHG